MTKKLYTVAINADPVEKLTYAGKRVELIIPYGTPIEVHDTRPNRDDLPDDHIIGTHCTRNRDTLLNTGIEYPSEQKTRETPDYLMDTIRRDAMYAWPVTKECLTKYIGGWGDIVYFTMPEDAVAVSSYRFLDLVTCDPSEYTIPVKHYEPSLTFTVQDFREACTTYDRPIPSKYLLL